MEAGRSQRRRVESGGLLDQTIPGTRTRRAAGGRTHRLLAIEGSEGALGRIILKQPHRRIYAELRWQVDNKEHSRYLCEVRGGNRKANLATAWRHAHEKGLTAANASPSHTAPIADSDFGVEGEYSAS